VGPQPVFNQPILTNRIDQSNINNIQPVIVPFTSQTSDPNGLPPSYDDVVRSNVSK
jgi:hypothetical protein